MWKHHTIYYSQPHSVIITIGGHIYRVPEVFPTIILEKQCHKVISHTTKFSLFTILLEGEQKDIETTIALAQDVFIQQKKINKIVEEYDPFQV
jgi:hypothetical protein